MLFFETGGAEKFSKILAQFYYKVPALYVEFRSDSHCCNWSREKWVLWPFATSTWCGYAGLSPTHTKLLRGVVYMPVCAWVLTYQTRAS